MSKKKQMAHTNTMMNMTRKMKIMLSNRLKSSKRANTPSSRRETKTIMLLILKNNNSMRMKVELKPLMLRITSTLKWKEDTESDYIANIHARGTGIYKKWFLHFHTFSRL